MLNSKKKKYKNEFIYAFTREEHFKLKLFCSFNFALKFKLTNLTFVCLKF